jgi:hypothetical protein
MTHRKRTPAFIVFYMLFWPETWRILMGVAAACLLGPGIIPSDLGTSGSWMMYFMMATIGYSVSAIPANGISRWMRKWFVRLFSNSTAAR